MAPDGMTWHDFALRLAAAGLINAGAPSEMALVRHAVKNMVKAGDLEGRGEARRAWSRRPLKLYGARRAVSASLGSGSGGSAPLTEIVRGWTAAKNGAC